MTRPSKRELERKVEDLNDVAAGDATLSPEIEERRSDEVVFLTYGVCRDLLRLTYHNADETINERDDVVATECFLELVREEYGIEADADRDQRLVETLVESARGDRQTRPINVFEMAPVGVATHLDIRAEDGTELAQLVEEGREEEAEQALIRETYDFVAGDPLPSRDSAGRR